jgi:hypothetical protein
MNGNAERSKNAGMPDRGTRCRRSGGLALLAAAAAIVLGGCGGSTAPSVANIATTSTPTTPRGTSGSNGSSTTATGKDATGFLVEWAACMRSHGDPNQTDPTVDNHYGINITIPLSAPAALSDEVHGGTAPCNQYLAAASNALKAEHPAPPAPSNDATGVRYAACMRANGVPNYPDPTGNRTNLRGIDMNSPFFIRANKLCGTQIGAPAWWINGWGPPGNISVSNIPPGGPGPNGPNRPPAIAGTMTTLTTVAGG